MAYKQSPFLTVNEEILSQKLNNANEEREVILEMSEEKSDESWLDGAKVQGDIDMEKRRDFLRLKGYPEERIDSIIADEDEAIQ